VVKVRYREQASGVQGHSRYREVRVDLLRFYVSLDTK